MADGLAAGIASIAALTLLVVAVQDKQAVTILLTVALTGANTLGFLPHNSTRPRSSWATPVRCSSATRWRPYPCKGR